MNLTKQQAEIQQKCEKYLAELDKFENDLKNSVQTFLTSEIKTCLVIETRDPKSGAIRLIHLLKRLKEDSGNQKKLGKYLEIENQTFLIWKQLRNLVETKVPQFTNLLVCQFPPSFKIKSIGEAVLNKLTDHLNVTLSKKVIFIIPPKRCLDVYLKKIRVQAFMIVDEINNKVSSLIYTDITKALMEEASKGDANGVIELINDGVDINIPCGWDDYTALHIAAEKGHKNVVLTLLQKGARILFDKQGLTPLHLAASSGHKEVVLQFLGNDVYVDIQGEHFGETPLNVAVEKGHEDVVRTLLENGARILPNSLKQTPLHIAARNGHKDVALVLLENNVDVNTKEGYGLTALHSAVRSGHSELIGVLIQHGADINARSDDDGSTALHMAVDNKDKEMIRTLLNHGAYLMCNNAKETPLHIAAKKGYIGVVVVFLEKGVDADIQGPLGQTALHQAVEYDKNKVANTLLEYGADVDAKTDNDGSTALSIAIDRNYIKMDVILTLLNHNVNVNAKKHSGRTALHEAAYNGHDDVVKILLEHSASVDAKDNNGETALYKALRCVVYKRSQVLNTLLDNGADVNATDISDNTPLHCAVMKCNYALYEVVQFLIDKGAEVNRRNREGKTALDLALEKDRDKRVVTLLNTYK